MKSVLKKIIFISFLLVLNTAVNAAGNKPTPPKQNWSWEGIFGTFDRGSAQRGYQVYKEVCSSCHGMDLIAFRTLEGIGFSEGEIEAIAAEYTYETGPNDEGEMFERAGLPSDKFKNPYANRKEAEATNNGAYPPDLSLMTKARKGGADYVYALLTGYEDPAPEGFEVPEGQYYNKWFGGHLISMAPPLSDDLVSYQDETPATLDQTARDVVTFLAWAAEPELEVRKSLGIKVILFLIIFGILAYLSKRKLWSNAPH